MKTKIIYIVSDIDKALAFEWIAAGLNREKFELSFILLNKKSSVLQDFCDSIGVKSETIYLHSGWKMVFTFYQLWQRLIKHRPHVIHTHLRYASILGISSGFLAGVKKRIHTRHHSDANHLYYKHAVKTDRWVSRLSTHIVSISDVVTRVLIDLEGVSDKKIVKIPHGFDLGYFSSVEPEREKLLKEKYLPQNSGPVVGVISRYLELKGIIYTIQAFGEIIKTYPNAHLVLANATGPYSTEIAKELSNLPENSFTEIKFEQDLAAVYSMFDVFVHVPIAPQIEAFGQTYIESLATGVPSVFTISGIAKELIVDEHNALVVDYCNSVEIAEAISRILADDSLRSQLIKNGRQSVEKFNLTTFINRLEVLYLNE